MRSFKAGVTGILLSTLILVVAATAQERAAAPAPPKAAPVATPAKTAPGAAVKPVAATTPAAEASKAEAPKVATGPRSIVGEVVDPACWIINGVSGKGHAECAIACAKAGQTLAILEKRTNKLYILAGEKPGEDPNQDVLGLVGVPVLVKGRVFSRHGALGIQVASVEPYPAKPMASSP